MSRRHRLLALLVVALAGSVAGGCGDEPESIVVTEPGAVVEVDVGDTVTVRLESNITTGYAWELERPTLSDVIRLVDDVYVEPDAEPGPDTDVVGAGGHQELTFEAVGEGTAEVSLWYVRDFDDPKEPADRARYEIVVTG